jgi:hypothetical protein
MGAPTIMLPYHRDVDALLFGLTIVQGSIILDVSVSFDEVTQAHSAVLTLRTAPPAALAASLGVAVQTVSTPAVTTRIVDAPSPPDPLYQFTPPTAPSSITLAVNTTGGSSNDVMLPLLFSLLGIMLLAAVAATWHRRRLLASRLAKGASTAADDARSSASNATRYPQEDSSVGPWCPGVGPTIAATQPRQPIVAATQPRLAPMLPTAPAHAPVGAVPARVAPRTHPRAGACSMSRSSSSRPHPGPSGMLSIEAGGGDSTYSSPALNRASLAVPPMLMSPARPAPVLKRSSIAHGIVRPCVPPRVAPGPAPRKGTGEGEGGGDDELSGGSLEYLRALAAQSAPAGTTPHQVAPAGATPHPHAPPAKPKPPPRQGSLSGREGWHVHRAPPVPGATKAAPGQSEWNWALKFDDGFVMKGL